MNGTEIATPMRVRCRLTAPFGASIRLRIPTKLGFKNPKSIVAMEVTNKWTKTAL
jgi:DMSO/TMAO reductase YedYZ molybdopterin-dependent catalytic subunit